jgi:ABC-type transport system involved in multi-copper enzyme maturation permease subunit
MTNLLFAEWVKLRRRLMPRIILGFELVVVVLTVVNSPAGGSAYTAAEATGAWPRALFVAMAVTGYLSVLLISILAGSWSGSEYAWGTIRLSLTARPNRSQQFFAGFVPILAFIAISLVTAAGVGALIAIGRTSGGAIPNFGLTLIEALLTEIAVMAYVGLIAYTAGAVFRSAAAGIGVGIGLYVVALIMERILYTAGGVWREIGTHLPYVYSANLTDRVFNSTLGTGSEAFSVTLTVAQSLAGMVAYTAVFIGIALVALNRRDVSA